MARKLWILYKVIFIICSVLNIKSTDAQFPKFSIQTNDSFSAVGEKVVINCFVYNVSVVDVMNDYDITWFKDDVKLTQWYTGLANDIITDKRYYISIGIQWGTTVSTVQIANITKEDEGVFSCELTNKMNAKQRKSISIRVEDPGDITTGSEIVSDASDSSINLQKSSFTNWLDAEEDENVMYTPSIEISSKETVDGKFSGNERESDVTTPVHNKIQIPAHNNIAIPAHIIAVPAHNSIASVVENNVTTPLLVSTDNNVENTSTGTGIEKREDSKIPVIAGVSVGVLVLFVMIIYCARRRNMLDCCLQRLCCYHKRNVIPRKYNLTPGEAIPEYADVMQAVSHPNYQNSQPKFVSNNMRQPYENPNDRAFLTVSAINETEFEERHDGRKGAADVVEQAELSDDDCNTGDQNLLAPHRSTSDQNLTVAHSNISDGNLLAVYRNTSEHNLSAVYRNTSEHNLSAVYRNTSEHNLSAVYRNTSEHNFSAVYRNTSEHNLSAVYRNTSERNLSAVYRNTSEHNLPDVYRNTSEHNLLAVNRNSSDDNLSDVCQDTSDDNLTDASERASEDSSDGQNKPPPKTNENPYESCNNMCFLKHYEA